GIDVARQPPSIADTALLDRLRDLEVSIVFPVHTVLPFVTMPVPRPRNFLDHPIQSFPGEVIAPEHSLNDLYWGHLSLRPNTLLAYFLAFSNSSTFQVPEPLQSFRSVAPWGQFQ